MGSEAGALVRAAQAGDEGAWAELVERFARMVWATARSFGLSASAASDVSQTTWLRLAEHVDGLRDPDRVGGWLATTARREAMRVSRLESRVVLIDPWTELAAMPASGDLDEEFKRGEQSAAVQEALGGLSSRCRDLLLALVADPPLSYVDVGSQFDMPIGSIGPTRARCLERLRVLLAEPDRADLDRVTTTRRSIS
jgi:RNA polymerase sigma factor (sigma-70 family)